MFTIMMNSESRIHNYSRTNCTVVVVPGSIDTDTDHDNVRVDLDPDRTVMRAACSVNSNSVVPVRVWITGRTCTGCQMALM